MRGLNFIAAGSFTPIFSSLTAVIRDFTQEFPSFRQFVLCYFQRALIGINFAHLFSKTLVKLYELRIQLTNQGHFSELPKRNFKETPGAPCRVFLTPFYQFDNKFRRVSYAEIGGYVNDTK